MYRNLVTRGKLRRITESSKKQFRDNMKLFLQHKAQHNCLELKNKKFGQCSCLKNLLARDNVIDKLANYVTKFWSTQYEKRNDEFEKKIHGEMDRIQIIKQKEEPSKIRFNGPIFCLRKEIENDSPLNTETDYKVCLSAYLTLLGKGYVTMLAIKKKYNKPKMSKKKEKGKQKNLSPTTEQIMTPTKPLPDDNGDNGDKTHDVEIDDNSDKTYNV